MASIRLESIRKEFGQVIAVAGLDLEIPNGEFAALLGPSGCGKTTTMNMIAGLEIPTAGTIYFNEKPMNEVPPGKRGVGFVFQNYAIFTHMTVEQNVGFGLKVTGRPTDEIQREVRKVADLLQLTPMLGMGAGRLSINDMQKVALGRSMITQPGIFLLDEAREFVVLRAASSEGGRQMVARGYRLKVGEVGVVGYVAGKTRPRIAFDVGEDAIYFHNLELPLTRSEMAIPLKLQERVIGVLDVQSSEAAAFSQDDVEILQVLADQVALAVDNARLITETNRVINELNRSYTHQSLQAWSERLKGRPAGFEYTRLGTMPAERSQMKRASQLQAPGVSEEEDGARLVVPIVVHGQVLGGITFRREKGEPVWTEEELHVVEQAIAQIGPALENARLLEEAQTRASREQTVNVIATQVRGAAGVQAILQNTVRELGKALGVSRTFIQFGMESSEDGTIEQQTPDSDGRE